jgi:hypothetical protein
MVETNMPPKSQHSYVEHTKLELGGFVVADATATGLRPHDDLIWIGINDGGRWVTPLDAVAYSRAIQDVVASHYARRGIASALVNGEKP